MFRLTARKGLRGHDIYYRVRNAYELLEKRFGSELSAEYLALASLHEDFGGGGEVGIDNDTSVDPVPLYLDDNGWMSDKPLAEWLGVKADPVSGHVLRLDLSNRSLLGTVPPAIAALTRLEYIDLTKNPDLELPQGSPIGDIERMLWDTRDKVRLLCEHLVLSHEKQRQAVVDRQLSRKHGPDGPALKRIFDDCDGRRWKAKWFIPGKDDVSAWHGVGVEEGRVVKLNFEFEIIAVPSSVLDLSSLKTLKACGGKLAAVADLPPTLTKLVLSECSSLTRLPPLPPVLETLFLPGCSSLVQLPALPPTLKSLDLSNCAALTSIDITSVKSLEYLDLLKCKSLVALGEPPLKLSYINMFGCSSLSPVPDLSKVQYVLGTVAD